MNGDRRIHEIVEPQDLDPSVIDDVAGGARLVIAPAMLKRLDVRRAEMITALQSGSAVYGVNTGMGALSTVRLDEQAVASHQRNLMLARAVGGPPWVDRGDARAVLAVRLRTFLSGDAGVSSQLCQRIVDMLEADLIPAVPRRGLGAAGEIIQLAHTFGPLAGIGSVLAPDGSASDAAERLDRLGWEPFRFGMKEGIASIQGVAGATALALRRGREVARLQAAMEVAAGLTIASVGATRDPYVGATIRGDDTQAGVLHRLRSIMGEEPSPSALQAPVSFRVVGQVFAHVERSTLSLADAVDRALCGITDSPAYLDGRFVGTSGFHGIELAAGCDQLVAALVHACDVASAMIHRLQDPKVTGLNPQLARTPGADAGMVLVHKRAVGATHALRRLALPVAIGAMETSTGQEDIQAFAWDAAENLRDAIDLARAVTACQLLTAYRAFTLSDRTPPPGCEPMLTRIADVVPPIDGDRTFGADIERLAAHLRSWP